MTTDLHPTNAPVPKCVGAGEIAVVACGGLCWVIFPRPRFFLSRRKEKSQMELIELMGYKPMAPLLSIPDMANGLESATKSSIEMSRTIADYGALVAMGGVMLIIILLLVGLFIYQLVVSQRNMNAIPALINELKKDMTILKEYQKDAAFRKIDVDQARALVAKEFDSIKNSVIARVIDIKDQNNLSDHEAVKGKISMFIQSVESGSRSFLRKFEFNDKVLSSFILPEWWEVLHRYMEKDCESHDFSYRLLENKYNLLLDRFKRLANEKIDEEIK